VQGEQRGRLRSARQRSLCRRDSQPARRIGLTPGGYQPRLGEREVHIEQPHRDQPGAFAPAQGLRRILDIAEQRGRMAETGKRPGQEAARVKLPQRRGRLPQRAARGMDATAGQ